MLTLKVYYRGDDGYVSESVLVGLQPFGDDYFSAFPLGSEHMQKLAYERIVDAFDVNTGEVISIRELCGARPLPGPLDTHPKRKSRPSIKKAEKMKNTYKSERRRDRQKFLMRFGNEIIWNYFRNLLISLFNGRCFACDSPRSLQTDHHVPFLLGGRLTAGNIVMLCSRCNAKKRDIPPSEFYSADELTHLAPLLERENQILAFQFDKDRWMLNPYTYLQEIGISRILISDVMTNPDHCWCIPKGFQDRELFVRVW
jgi:5-methylcytosine-specific restriction endonuclease McrA